MMIEIYVNELPHDCLECMCNDDNCFCGATREEIFDYDESRREDCPLKLLVHCKDCEFGELMKKTNRVTGITCSLRAILGENGYCNLGAEWSILCHALAEHSKDEEEEQEILAARKGEE